MLWTLCVEHQSLPSCSAGINSTPSFKVSHICNFFWLKNTAFQPSPDFIMNIWCSLEEVMHFQTLSALSFHQLSSWAICFFYSLWPHLLSVPCVCCGTNCAPLDRETARAVGQKNPLLSLLVLKLQKEKPLSLDFLPMSVATWNTDLLSNVFGNKHCTRSWQSWVRSCGSRWWSRSFWKLSLQAEGSRRGEERHRIVHQGKKD